MVIFMSSLIVVLNLYDYAQHSMIIALKAVTELLWLVVV